MGIKAGTCVVLAVLLLTAAPTWSADIHGTSSTQLLWFNDFYNGREIDLAEYLQISVTKIDKDGKFNIYGYGRGTQDFSNGNGLNGRLYYLYGEYRDILDKVDVRVGRQFVNLSAGSTIIDGGQVDIKNIGPVAFTFLGGRDVIFGLNGELTHEGDYALGMVAYLTGFKRADLDVSWLRKWDTGDVSRDIVGTSGKLLLFNNVKLYGNARYDLTGEVFSEVLGGIKYFPIASLVLTGEWYQSYPVFDNTSIYSVFAVNRYQEWVFRGDYTINDMIAVNAGYTRELFGDSTTADVYEFGCTLRPLTDLTVGLAYNFRTGYGGPLNGGSLDVTWNATKELQLAGGLAVDAYNREFFPSSGGNQTAQKYWLGGKYKLAKNMSASLRIEDDTNENYNANVQGRFVFNYTF